MPEASLTDERIDTADVARSVEAPGFGAVVSFAGLVRDNAQGRQVLYLEYEAYAPLARKQLWTLAQQAEERWGVRCAVAHRLGRLEIGECSVAVAVASPHRAEAFTACSWLMDTLKATVPIWKKEHFVGGICWIEGPGSVPAVTDPEKTIELS